MRKMLITLMLALSALPCAIGQSRQMSLNEAVATARGQSVAALSARNEFISAYWAWRSYKASLLPSVVLYGNLINFNRSLTLLQNYETGDMIYANTYNLQNSLGLAIRQNVTFTGGTLSLYSDLSRLDQFGGSGSLMWYAQPITLSYTQPIFAYNQFKWDKLIEPLAYKRSKITYIERMETIGIEVAEAFFELAAARLAHESTIVNHRNSRKMLSVARERLALGSITRDEYIQLEMRMLSDSIKINETEIRVRTAQMALNSLLSLDERTEIEPQIDDLVPDLVLDYEQVLVLSLDNSGTLADYELEILQAKSDVARAKANRGISIGFNARFGLSKTASEFRGVYLNPLDQEVAGLTFSIPLFDWGLGKGRVQKAKAAQAVVEAKVQQAENDYRRRVFSEVARFNSQRGQCLVSARAAELARERYDLVVERFRSGSVTVTEFNNAQSEKDSAVDKYMQDIGTWWKSYLGIRKMTLYDFISGAAIDIDPEEMMEL